MRNTFGSLILIISLFLAACSVHKETVGYGSGWVDKELRKLDSFDDHQWGFGLYSATQQKWLYRRNSDQYFTPASNTKILTLYTALVALGETTSALRYIEAGDTLIFWGTGDPSLMYHVPDSNRVVEFLEGHPAEVIKYAPLSPVVKFGPGWAWDDFGFSYQVERSTLPVYGNRLTFTKLALELDGEVTPNYFKDYVVEDQAITSFTDRLAEGNAFSINTSLIDELPFERTIPFVVSDYDIAAILSELTGREINLDYDFVHPKSTMAVSGTPTDTLYRMMMQESDNFIAEQLVIQVADALNIELGVDSVIQMMQTGEFEDAPQKFQWYDGSGLSRYNLFTPESLVWLLGKLKDEYGLDYLKDIFPAGGVSGTISDFYSNPGSPPHLYAKTGTLKNKHCLSGYLLTSSGDVLIFSMMHGNFIGSSGKVKRDMEKLFRAIYEKY